MKKAFTLAEVLITITAIGIISAIILPVALHSRPDENLLKFKKAHNTLYQVIGSLISSERYYKDGDLGRRAGTDEDNELLDTTHEGDCAYFCQTFADLLTTKVTNCNFDCSEAYNTGTYHLGGGVPHTVQSNKDFPKTVDVTEETIESAKRKFDLYCKNKTYSPNAGEEIVTTDGIVYYEVTSHPFGYKKTGYRTALGNFRLFSPPEQHPANIGDEDGFDIVYKIMCIDVDGIPAGATAIDCKNECPFGYGIRADGKILPGTRAEEWLARDPQKED